MPITISTERDKDLTTFVGRGRLESAEIQDAITEFYRNGPTTNVLWDIRRATIGHLNTDDIHNIRQVIALRAGQRQNGKTAIVTARDLDFGITRMGEAYAQDLPLDFMMFRNLEEAESWLNG